MCTEYGVGHGIVCGGQSIPTNKLVFNALADRSVQHPADCILNLSFLWPDLESEIVSPMSHRWRALNGYCINLLFDSVVQIKFGLAF